jgi:polysaccharide deacetylase 2 family uncharacterized protein YibQ
LADELGVPWAANDRLLDNGPASRAAIDARVIQVERIALEQGGAIAMARPFPVTIDGLVEWTRRLPERGYVLAPITAMANLRDVHDTHEAAARR